MEGIEGQLPQLETQEPAVQKLMTLPGVDFYSAQVTLEEIRDIPRFPDERKLSSYAGWRPVWRRAGTPCGRGTFTNKGRRPCGGS